MATIGRLAAKPRLDVGEGVREAGQIRFLRQIVDCGAWLGEAIPGIGLHQPGGNAQQGGFAGAVAPDQADPEPAATVSSAPESSGVTPKVRVMSCNRSNGAGMAKEISRDGPC